MRSEGPTLSVSEAMQLGLEHHRAGRLPEAERILRGLLAIDPNYPDALNLLGIIAHQVGRTEISVELITKAVRNHPSNPYFQNNLGNALKELHRHDEALTCFEQALAIKPDYAAALYNKGNALDELKRYEEALTSYDEALKIQPDYAEALGNRGNTLQALNRCDEALASYGQALKIRPDLAPIQWTESLCRLLVGDYERGWQTYEWRWRNAMPSTVPRNFLQPLWLGKEEIAGKTVLLHAEQGLGDTIQFVRYAQLVAERRAKVILEVQPALRPLLSSMSGAHQIVSRGESLPGFDYHCPLLSLPLAFNTRLETIPAKVPYLAIGETSVSSWRRKLAGDGKPLVGLCWKGSPTYKRDGERSLRLTELGPLLKFPNVRFVSLQKDLDDEERATTAGMQNFIHPGRDFQDTAEMIGALDLVISVDTAWAHWAGSIGKPVWVLLPIVPHWCWLQDRNDSPWYPTARLFRQTRRGDWDNVLIRVHSEASRLFQ